MFISKKHLSRRTLLRGAGTAIALPLLDSMIPAHTALAQTAANPELRAWAIFIFPMAPRWRTGHLKKPEKILPLPRS